ncbi:hypothetical protein [Hyphomonas sp.]|jgi:hypothetical protein|uniref:hypothetical protein n=1 Tax=Hyphomonas sp. TaxID=87 RepID=UPI0025C419DF|nr:hypothetical protein [Hyphomonas sp.]
MSQTAYLVSCEILCGEGSDGALAGMERAFMIVGVNAASDDDAMAKIEADFEEQGYAIADVEWLCEASQMEWEDAEGEAEAKSIIARLAAEPGEVVHGELYESSEDGLSEAA